MQIFVKSLPVISCWTGYHGAGEHFRHSCPISDEDCWESAMMTEVQKLTRVTDLISLSLDIVSGAKRCSNSQSTSQYSAYAHRHCRPMPCLSYSQLRVSSRRRHNPNKVDCVGKSSTDDLSSKTSQFNCSEGVFDPKREVDILLQ